MKVLVVHNFYISTSPSGEDNAVRNHLSDLRSEEIEVHTLFFYNDRIPKGIFGAIFSALAYVSGAFSVFHILLKIFTVKPDIIHVHNLFPLISPLTLPVMAMFSPVIYTFHNYRNFCAAGVPLKGGRHCELCFHGDKLAAMKFKCYRGSFFATLPIFFVNAVLRTTSLISRCCSSVIAFTEFQKNILISQGVDEELIAVRPNVPPVQGSDFLACSGAVVNDRIDALFVGRLSEEKGVEELCHHWTHSTTGLVLGICGDGPQIEELRSRYAGPQVKFYGRVPKEQVRSYIQEARSVVVPSLCWEGYPLVIADALQLKKPIIVTQIGPLPEIVGDLGIKIPIEPFMSKEEVGSTLFERLDSDIFKIEKKLRITGNTTQTLGRSSYRELYMQAKLSRY